MCTFTRVPWNIAGDDYIRFEHAIFSRSPFGIGKIILLL